jgi:uncharacterized protein (DUF433 family)
MMLEHNLITRDPEILGGIPVFAGTRVPVQTMLDYFEKGYPFEEFLDDFPTVTIEHAQAVLALLKKLLLERADERVVG